VSEGASAGFVPSLRRRAAEHRRRIVFPETSDPRTVAAVRTLVAEGIVEPVLILDPSAPGSHDAVRALGVEILDPTHSPYRQEIGALLERRRRARGMMLAEAEQLAAVPLWFATGLVGLGVVHGSVAGAVSTTADVLRAAIWMVGPAPGVRTISSAFYMIVPQFRNGDPEEVLTFTDCAVVPEPTAEQLADIALAAAEDRRRVVGDEPRVAFLSFSTHGSGAGETVERVRSAVGIARAREPHLSVDGELQGDAAIIPGVGRRKAPDSPVAGRANVLVFPSLDAGNIAYKLVERIARAVAVGPVVQGLASPCNDLSRGASADDIINVAAITALKSVEAAQVRGHGSDGRNIK
jgi:phosphate acetyltransferase